MASKPLGKGTVPLLDPALCRCCRHIKRCRLLTAEYEFEQQKEIYSDMFLDCFGLVLSNLDVESECGICATCVLRLRDASAFHKQVLTCEEILLTAKLKRDIDKTAEEFVVKREEASDHESMGEDIATMSTEDIETKNIDEEIKVEETSFTNCALGTDQSDKASPNKEKVMSQSELENNVKKLQEKLDAMLDNDNTVKDWPEVDFPASKPEKRRKTRSMTKGKASKKTKRSSDLKGGEKVKKSKRKSIEKPTEKVKKEVKIEQQLKNDKNEPKEIEMDRNQMIFQNVVTIVHNSYVCPFLNRISNYYCYYCKDQFVDPTELREHTLSHSPKKFVNMMENKKIPKIDVTRIDCRLCDEKIDDIVKFKSHITTNHGQTIHPVENEFLKFKLTLNNLTCTECSQSFPYFDMLKKHMIEHFGTQTCDICGACFLENTSLRTHLKTHNRVEQSFPCEICSKVLKSKYSKQMHVATVHEKKPVVNCYKCDASFLSYALRNRHLIETHGDKRTFPCKSCDKVYNRRKTLMEHNRRYHLKVYKHQCHLCDQKFYLPSRLKEHMVTHTGERNYHCSFCDKSYPRLQSLQEHMRSHGNERRNLKTIQMEYEVTVEML